MEWFDQNAVGLPPGDVSEENRKKLWVPEIALQNTLKTGVEIHYPPEVIFSEKGHVAAKVLYQAPMLISQVKDGKGNIISYDYIM